jgi:hypothetical protein
MQWALQGDSGSEELLWRRSELGGIGREGSSSVAVQHFAGKKRVSGAERVWCSARSLSLCVVQDPAVEPDLLTRSALVQIRAWVATRTAATLDCQPGPGRRPLRDAVGPVTGLDVSLFRCVVLLGQSSGGLWLADPVAACQCCSADLG